MMLRIIIPIRKGMTLRKTFVEGTFATDAAVYRFKAIGGISMAKTPATDTKAALQERS